MGGIEEWRKEKKRKEKKGAYRNKGRQILLDEIEYFHLDLKFGINPYSKIK